jgi:hypothetical protein
MVHLIDGYAGRLQAILDGMRRKFVVVFLTSESLFFRSSDKLPSRTRATPESW